MSYNQLLFRVVPEMNGQSLAPFTVAVPTDAWLDPMLFLIEQRNAQDQSDLREQIQRLTFELEAERRPRWWKRRVQRGKRP